MLNFHGVHSLELLRWVPLQNHSFANNYPKNINEVVFCR